MSWQTFNVTAAAAAAPAQYQQQLQPPQMQQFPAQQQFYQSQYQQQYQQPAYQQPTYTPAAPMIQHGPPQMQMHNFQPPNANYHAPQQSAAYVNRGPRTSPHSSGPRTPPHHQHQQQQRSKPSRSQERDFRGNSRGGSGAGASAGRGFNASNNSRSQPSSMVPPEAKIQKLCRDVANGHACRFGVRCKYAFHTQSAESKSVQMCDGVPIEVAPEMLTVRLSLRGLDDAKLTAMCADGGWFPRILEPWLETFERTSRSRKPVVMALMENNIGDAGTEALAAYLLKQRCFDVFGIKLWKNMISDRGAVAMADFLRKARVPIRELHLSHNFIGDVGAKALLTASAAVYGVSTVTPLWLRIEWNECSPALFESALLASASSAHATSTASSSLSAPQPPLVCDATSLGREGAKKICSLQRCGKFTGKNVCLHVFCARFQYSSVKQSGLLSQLIHPSAAQSSASSSSSADSKREVKQDSSTEPTDAVMRDASASPSTALATASPTVSSRPGAKPLILFLDTCSVVRMIQPKNKPDKPFTWSKLIARAVAAHPTFGCGISDPRERVHLVFTNVVMRELDSQSQTRGGEFADMIRGQLRMQDTENSLLAVGRRLGFIETLAVSHSILAKAAAENEVSGGAALFPNTQNDNKILLTAEEWQTQLQHAADVVFITDDLLLAERARSFSKVPTCSVKALNSVLPDNPAIPWTASLFRDCFARLSSASPDAPKPSLASTVLALASPAASSGSSHASSSSSATSGSKQAQRTQLPLSTAQTVHEALAEAVSLLESMAPSQQSFETKSLLARCEHWSGLLRAKAFVDDDEKPLLAPSAAAGAPGVDSAAAIAGASPMLLDDDADETDEALLSAPATAAEAFPVHAGVSSAAEDFSPSAWPSVAPSSASDVHVPVSDSQ